MIFLELCKAPNFCCESGIQGDQECLGKCIKESRINNGKKDCDNGSDEEVIGNIYYFYEEMSNLLI